MLLDDSYYTRLVDIVRSDVTNMADRPLFVPFDIYRSEDVADREKQNIFDVCPLPILHSSELPDSGSYFAKTLLGKPLLFTRDKTGVAHVFENICRHRASKIVEDGCGKRANHTCPYHGWTYNVAGELIGLPGRAGFTGVELREHGLTELPSEERHGMVWVKLNDRRPIDVAAFLGEELDGILSRSALADLQTVKGPDDLPLQFTMPCNWKSVFAAFQENYHFSAVHSKGILADFSICNMAVFQALDGHGILLFPSPKMRDLVDVEPEAWPKDAITTLLYVFPSTIISFSVVGGGEMTQFFPGSGDENIRSTEMEIKFFGQPDYPEEVMRLVHHAVTTEDLPILRNMRDTQPSASHDYEIIGRNEIAVQNGMKWIARQIGFDLAPWQPGVPAGDEADQEMTGATG